MKQRYISAFIAAIVVSLGVTACNPALPAPAKHAAYPEKGKTITLIVPWAAGGSVDVFGRLIAPAMEKELGVQVEVVNKPGAGAQVGMTDLAKAQPDGYTIGIASLPGLITIYLDPNRKAAFTSKSFEMIALTGNDPEAIAVPANSRFQTVKDLAEAARANPGSIKVAAGGLMGDSHLGALLLEKAIGTKLAIVTFDGGLTPALTAMLGGHTDAFVGVPPSLTPVVKSGEVRVIGVMDKAASKFLPGVKTMDDQGFANAIMGASRGIVAPAGTPKEVVDTLAAAVKKAMATNEVKNNLDEAWSVPQYGSPEEFAAHWNSVEAEAKKLMEEIH